MANSNTSSSSASSTASGCVSVETQDTSEDNNLLPSSLAAEELMLALNNEATEEELKKAIYKSKELVLKSANVSAERKWLVRHLIELRLRLQECREAKNDPQHPRNKSNGALICTVRGHHLQLKPVVSNASKYCDHCTGSIWHMVQSWYQCQDCGYTCHHKCMTGILRECAHVTVSEKGGYETNICPEEGLSAQRYQCAECKTNLPIVVNGWSYTEVRKCDYTGLYFCSACHWGGLAIIPARLMHNWDFIPRPVSQAALQLLKITSNRPLINLEKQNPQLFPLVHELSLVKRSRIELYQMRKYLLVCRFAQYDHYLSKTGVAHHLIELPELYSLHDLVDTNSGELPTKLLNLAAIFIKHIKEECEVCRGRGHICEICSNDEVLFPFDATAVVCKECNAVFHKNCFTRKNNECPKCFRLLLRNEKNEVESEVAEEVQ